MDAIFLAALAVWFSGRALWLTYQRRLAVVALVHLTCEAIVLRETLDYAHEALSRFSQLEGECLKAFYEKTHKLHADEFEQDAIKQL